MDVAKEEFELVPPENRGASSKLYSRGDFLPVDDDRAMSEGDFIGRLRALFGPVDGDVYVLRHRATGLVVTAYSAQSGPAYGAPLEQDPTARGARIAAAPLPERPALSSDPRSMTEDQLRTYREQMHAWMRRVNDIVAPPGVGHVVARLEALLDEVEPVDWESLRYYGDEPSVYRVGVRDGDAFVDDLSVEEGMEILLEQAEQQQAPMKDHFAALVGADPRVVDYWLHHANQGTRLESVLPRVQAAWFRAVEHSKSHDKPLRDYFLIQARERIADLGLDERAAEEALSR